jgi:hypothetical protein
MFNLGWLFFPGWPWRKTLEAQMIPALQLGILGRGATAASKKINLERLGTV